MRVVGLMSGTSADGVDAAVVDVSRDADRVRVATIETSFLPYSPEVRAAVLDACQPATGTVDHICRLNALLGEWFARAAKQVIDAAGLRESDVDLIASHGQTIYHAAQPGNDPPSTLQIGEPSVIAERTGRTVVANFRARDVAAGGQGAPLVSYVDYLLLADAERSRAVLNLGGIANVTLLPAAAKADDVRAFDTGPGNMVVDALSQALFGVPFDRDGRIARSGRVDETLLADLASAPYFASPLPKTTGREQFGRAYSDRLLVLRRERSLASADVVATATRLTARSIAAAFSRFLPPLDDVVVSGGGASNPTLLSWLAEELRQRGIAASLSSSAAFGVSPDFKEAIAFAVLGYESLNGRVGTLPRCTGAPRAVVLGAIVPGDNYRELLDRVSAAR